MATICVVAVFFVFLALIPGPPIRRGRILAHDARHRTSFDGVAELLIAVASPVAVQERIVEESCHANEELAASQERPRRLVNPDPLTSLLHRRGFRRERGGAESRGAVICFMAISNFKGINARRGHSVGGARLTRVADLLAQRFRSEDARFRWGGDEFLVLAPGLHVEGAARRVAQPCSELARTGGELPAGGIAVGVALLAPGGIIGAVLHEADARTYGDTRRTGVVSATGA